MIAATATLGRHMERNLAVALSEEDLGAGRAELRVALQQVDEWRQPSRVDRGVVVEQRHVLHVAEVGEAEVAPAGEPEVLRAADDTDYGERELHPVGDAIRRPVVDEHDLEPRCGPFGAHEALQALEREVATVEVDDDRANKRRERARGSHPAVSSATRRSSGSR